MSEQEMIKDAFRQFAIQKYITSRHLPKGNPMYDKKMKSLFQDMSMTDIYNVSKSLQAEELFQEKLNKQQAIQIADQALELFQKKLKGLKIK